jgi:MFS family permease
MADRTAVTERTDSRAQALRRARLGTALTFAFNGFLWAAWVPHIPQVKASLGLSDAALGLALLGPAIGSMVSMPLVGKAITRWGSARATTATAFGTYLFIAGPGIAWNLPSLFAALVLWGVVTGALDVAMNAQAVEIEKAYRRPIMSSFHAWWSIGTVTGTAAGSVGAGLGVSLARQQFALAVLLALVTLWSMRQFIADQPAEQHADRPGRVFELRLVLLGIAGICGLLAEGSSGDWSPVYLRDDLRVSAGHTGLAYLAFTAMMTMGRLIGDRVIDRLGRARSIATVSAIGTVGMTLGLLVHTLPAAIAGFGCLGLGLSVLVPVFFSTAADGPGAAGPKLALVSSFSYLGFLIGPAALGPLASATSIHSALWVLPSFAALAGLLGVVAVRMTARIVPASGQLDGEWSVTTDHSRRN